MPVVAIPVVMYLCRKAKTMVIGSSVSTVIARMRFHCTLSSPWKEDNPTCRVKYSLRLKTINGQRKSFQRHITEKIVNTARAGFASGRMICA